MVEPPPHPTPNSASTSLPPRNTSGRDSNNTLLPPQVADVRGGEALVETSPKSGNPRRLLGVLPNGEHVDYLKVVNFVSVLETGNEEDKISLPDGSYFVRKGAKGKPLVETVYIWRR